MVVELGKDFFSRADPTFDPAMGEGIIVVASVVVACTKFVVIGVAID